MNLRGRLERLEQRLRPLLPAPDPLAHARRKAFRALEKLIPWADLDALLEQLPPDLQKEIEERFDPERDLVVPHPDPIAFRVNRQCYAPAEWLVSWADEVARRGKPLPASIPAELPALLFVFPFAYPWLHCERCPLPRPDAVRQGSFLTLGRRCFGCGAEDTFRSYRHERDQAVDFVDLLDPACLASLRAAGWFPGNVPRSEAEGEGPERGVSAGGS
jgi:hypothetical protein